MTYRFATFLLLLMVIALLVAGAWPAEVTPSTPMFPDLSQCDGRILGSQESLSADATIIRQQSPLQNRELIARSLEASAGWIGVAQICYHNQLEDVYRRMGWPIVVAPGASEPMVPPLYKGPEVQARLEVRP